MDLVKEVMVFGGAIVAVEAGSILSNGKNRYEILGFVKDMNARDVLEDLVILKNNKTSAVFKTAISNIEKGGYSLEQQ